MRLWWVTLSILGATGCTPVSASTPAPGPHDDIPLADGFDFPVGTPDAEGYYDAQPFGRNHHLGEDWNGNGGGDTDLGDPITVIAHGQVVSAAYEGRGWGNIVRVVHRIDDDGHERIIESFYAHLDRMDVSTGQIVSRGEQLGTMGSADGLYYAHLHFELRDEIDMPVGPGYAIVTAGWLSPIAFIQSHRPSTDSGE